MEGKEATKGRELEQKSGALYTTRRLGFSRNYGIHQATCQRRHSRRRAFSLLAADLSDGQVLRPCRGEIDERASFEQLE